jgi:hypothetical protein
MDKQRMSMIFYWKRPGVKIVKDQKRREGGD